MTLTSRLRGQEDAFSLVIEAGDKSEIAPARLDQGTEIEIRDLFFATPARLKFLKTDRSETSEALDVLRRLAMAHHEVGFSFATEERRWLDALEAAAAAAGTPGFAVSAASTAIAA